MRNGPPAWSLEPMGSGQLLRACWAGLVARGSGSRLAAHSRSMWDDVHEAGVTLKVYGTVFVCEQRASTVVV